jgi:hypothetical protein
MLQINHILLLLILLASHMDSQSITFWLRSVLPAPPQDHKPTISSTISLPICEPIFISPTSYRNSPMGPPPFISFFMINSELPGACISHWGTRFCICTFFPKLFIIYYLLYKHLYFQSVHSLSSPLATCFFGHTQPMSPLDWSSTYHLPLPTSSISSEYPAGQLPLPSEFVHLVPPLAQLSPGLVVPLTLDLVTRLRPLFSSYILQPREVLSHPTS